MTRDASGWGPEMCENRQRIDPEGKYELGNLRQFERFALRVLDVLPGARVERARDVIQITPEDERGIIVIVTPEAIELRLPTVEWTAPYAPLSSSRFWKRVKWEGIGEVRLSRLLESARQARADEFRRCRFCGQEFPPEQGHEKDVCQGCAERHLGIVH